MELNTVVSVVSTETCYISQTSDFTIVILRKTDSVHAAASLVSKRAGERCRRHIAKFIFRTWTTLRKKISQSSVAFQIHATHSLS